MTHHDALAEAWAHPSAIIDEGAHLGGGTRVWHFAHVCAGATIGQRCSLGQNVYVAPSAKIGDGVKIQNNVSIYDGVILDDDVFCGPSVVFTNVRHPRAHVSRRHAYQTTRICRGATLGANATVVCGVEVGEFAFVGAGAVVTADVAPYALVVGQPARQIGWSCRCGLTLPAPESQCTCTECGQRYTLSEGTLKPV
ncbi:N-acetyltransferase [Lujinxingia sediminis]|uniref:N-acetyltransferase n=1 Tax=Lujinxingia sediminis TaxID=2480984 RepID=A0ABY0CPQ5_9DELT|nr:acyltransferase [Lujinxingia sediminis]RVU42158.1 N-acetyltransferase [Lujinxingia sediminis]